MNATHAGRWQFSVRSMLIVLLGGSLVMGIGPLLLLDLLADFLKMLFDGDRVVYTRLPLMALVYIGARRARLRAQVVVLVCMIAMTLPPTLGCVPYSLCSEISHWRPPQIYHTIPPGPLREPLVVPLRAMYRVAEWPCTWDGSSYFVNSHVIRPFAVWTFWWQMAGAAALAIVACNRRRLGHWWRSLPSIKFDSRISRILYEPEC